MADLSQFSTEELLASLGGMVPTEKPRPAVDLGAIASEAVAQDPGSYIGNLLDAARSGITFNWLDEASGKIVEQAAQGDVRAQQAGELEKLIERERAAKFAEENPKAAAAAQIVAGAAPFITGPLASLGFLGQTALGGLMGAASGAGAAQEGERAAGAVLGGGIGAAAPAVIGLAAKGAGAGIGKLGELTDEVFGSTKLEQQIGAAGRRPYTRAAKAPAVTPGEAVVASKLKELTPQEIADLALTLRDAGDVPVNLADVGKSATRRQARLLVQRPGSEEFRVADDIRFSPTEFLEQRRAAAPARIDELVSDYSPAMSPEAAGQELIESGDVALEALKQARREATAPLYQAVGEYQPGPEVMTALDDPLVKIELQQIASDPALAKFYEGRPPTDPKVLIDVRNRLREIGSNLASKQGGRQDTQRAAAYFDSADKLTKALQTQPEFQPANDLYREMSGSITKLAGEGGRAGYLSQFKNISDLKTADAGQVLMQMSADQVQEFKTLLGKEGETAMRSGVKAYITKITRGTKENRQVAAQLFATPKQQEALKAAVGEKEAEKLLKKIGLEKLMERRSGEFLRGSDTARLLQGEEELQSAVGRVMPLVKEYANPMTYLDMLASRTIPDETAAEAAYILFDPMRSRQFLAERGDFLQSLAQRQQSINALESMLRQPAPGIGAAAGGQSTQIGGGKK